MWLAWGDRVRPPVGVAMNRTFRVITYNIRKGKGSSGAQNVTMCALGDALAPHAADLVLCQEVFHAADGSVLQTGELADALSFEGYYGANKFRKVGDHGNSTFSRRAAREHRNHDISTNPIERRGVLHARFEVDGRTLHVFNAHLGLNGYQRRAQVKQIDTIVQTQCGDDDPVLLAGDFNDWRGELDRHVVEDLGLHNIFHQHEREDILTWPAQRPMLNLDRIYVRNIDCRDAGRLHGDPWSILSDHLPLWADLEL